MKDLTQKIKRDILDLSQYATYPPSEKQAWYCAKLLAERGVVNVAAMFDTSIQGGSVTGKEVSQLISLLIDNQEMFKKAG